MASSVWAQLSALRIEDFATLPQTGIVGAGGNQGYMARVNFMADDPSNPTRFFVNDLNGPLYLLDKQSRQFTTYLDFNGTGANPGLFDRFYYNQGGFAAGFITFQFDPDYRNNGKFYTVHMESGTSGSQLPTHPQLDTTNYGLTAAIDEPGFQSRQEVLVEWTDTNLANSTFEGSARERLRLEVRDRIHPIGDIIFNPTAGPSDPDWRMMYVAVGDSGAGEQSDANIRRTPQLLNTYTGKILRIAPDANVNIATTLSPNGKYRIPTDNPFTGVADQGGVNGAVRDEIWALGFRNPHRLSWDVDPTNPNPLTNNHLIVSDIGLGTWEEINIVNKGGNYGYSQREGNQRLSSTFVPSPLPGVDTVPRHQICGGADFSACTSDGTTTPLYPVIQYGHRRSGQDQLLAGDAVSSGFVYRGTAIPQLYGKFVFGDITTGAIYYSDLAAMLAADDGNPNTMAPIESLGILWNDPHDAPDQGEELYATTATATEILGSAFPIVQSAYYARTGLPAGSPLPQTATVTGAYGRADIRLQVDSSGELYILSKSDGMIRAVVGPQPLPGDYNYDGLVTTADYQVWAASFGSTVPRLGLWADGAANSLIEAADYTRWRDNLVAPVSVPEVRGVWVLAMLMLCRSLIWGCHLAKGGAAQFN